MCKANIMRQTIRSINEIIYSRIKVKNIFCSVLAEILWICNKMQDPTALQNNL